LYISDLFAKARDYATSRFDSWYILSAKHGLLKPKKIIDPYECTLNNMAKTARSEWSERVFTSIESNIESNSIVTFVAGERYREGLIQKLQERGYQTRIPLQGLSIGMQLSWLKKLEDERARLRDLDEFYALLNKLQNGLGGRRLLKECTGAIDWPKMGVYFFFEQNEYRTSDVAQDRIVRVGTHTVSKGSQSTLWHRLRTHRGGADGSGNHRGSIFRLHVGAALISKSHGEISTPTWGNGQTAAAEIRCSEAALEKVVSDYIGRMSLLWISIADEPRASSDRAFIEQNSIALLSGKTGPIDRATQNWLGTWSAREAIRKSGLWNVNYVEDDYDPRFLETMAVYVDVTLGKTSLPKNSIAPRNWALEKRNRRDRRQLTLFKEQ
jgi:hypothetical protein